MNCVLRYWVTLTAKPTAKLDASGASSIGHFTRHRNAAWLRPSACAVCSIRTSKLRYAGASVTNTYGATYRLCASHRPPSVPSSRKASVTWYRPLTSNTPGTSIGTKTPHAARASQCAGVVSIQATASRSPVLADSTASSAVTPSVGRLAATVCQASNDQRAGHSAG